MMVTKKFFSAKTKPSEPHANLHLAAAASKNGKEEKAVGGHGSG
jgi:hypothetical protein